MFMQDIEYTFFEMFTFLAISHIFTQWSSNIILSILLTISSVVISIGRPEHSACVVLERPPWNFVNHLWIKQCGGEESFFKHFFSLDFFFFYRAKNNLLSTHEIFFVSWINTNPPIVCFWIQQNTMYLNCSLQVSPQQIFAADNNKLKT